LAVELGDGMGDLAGGWQNLVLGQAKNDGYHQAGRVWCRRGVAPGGVGSITLAYTGTNTGTSVTIKVPGGRRIILAPVGPTLWYLVPHR
jgi:hypothetical protein